MKLRLLNAQAVRTALPMHQCIGLMRQAMLLVARGQTLQPIRTALPVPTGKGLLSLMPGYTEDPHCLGIKVITVFPGNFGTERGSHQGMVLLFDPEHGAPVAILDGREITAIRTAAATAVATDALARTRVSTLAILGYGEQAHSHVQSLTEVRKFERIIVWGRDVAKARLFCEQATAMTGCPASPALSAREAVRDADVICTTTAAAEPIFEGKWLQPGQHLNVVGSSIPTTSEVDVETVIRSRFFVDFRESALALAGDFRRARSTGAIGEDHIVGSVGDVLAGLVPGRRSHDDITLFKSLGMVSEDLVAADFVLRECEQHDLGTLVEW